MKVVLDENMSAAMIELLRGAGHDPATIAEEALSGIGDEEVIKAASAQGRVLMTKAVFASVEEGQEGDEHTEPASAQFETATSGAGRINYRRPCGKSEGGLPWMREIET